MQISSKTFVAGLVFGPTGIVERAAPIIKYMQFWSRKQVLRYAASRGWTVSEEDENIPFQRTPQQHAIHNPRHSRHRMIRKAR